MSEKKKAYEKCEGCGAYRKVVEAVGEQGLKLCADCQELYGEMSEPDDAED